MTPDPSFWTGLLGPALLFAALVIGAWALRRSNAGTIAATTITLLEAELKVARERGDRLQLELAAANATVEDLKRTRSMEPVMQGLAKVMVGLTEATQSMVNEVEEATQEAAARHDAVMRRLEQHEAQAAERHEIMLEPLRELATAITNGAKS